MPIPVLDIGFDNTASVLLSWETTITTDSDGREQRNTPHAHPRRQFSPGSRNVSGSRISEALEAARGISGQVEAILYYDHTDNTFTCAQEANPGQTQYPLFKRYESDLSFLNFESLSGTNTDIYFASEIYPYPSKSELRATRGYSRNIEHLASFGCSYDGLQKLYSLYLDRRGALLPLDYKSFGDNLTRKYRLTPNLSVTTEALVSPGRFNVSPVDLLEVRAEDGDSRSLPAYDRPIRYPKVSSLRVTLDGSPVAFDWSEDNHTLTLNQPPTQPVELIVEGQFYVLTRLASQVESIRFLGKGNGLTSYGQPNWSFLEL